MPQCRNRSTSKAQCNLNHYDNDPANKTNSTLTAMLEIVNIALRDDDSGGEAAEANRSVVAPEAFSFLMRSSHRPVTV